MVPESCGRGAQEGGFVVADFKVEGHTLTVRGELGPESEVAFQKTLEGLLDLDVDQYVIDLSGVRYMSSGYVGPIALLMVEARKRGRPVTVLAREKAAGLFRLGGLDRLAEVRVVDENGSRPDEEVGLERLKGGS